MVHTSVRDICFGKFKEPLYHQALEFVYCMLIHMHMQVLAGMDELRAIMGPSFANVESFLDNLQFLLEEYNTLPGIACDLT